MVTVCEILSNPLNYDGMFVTVRDRTAGTAEGLWLIGQECPEFSRRKDMFGKA